MLRLLLLLLVVLAAPACESGAAGTTPFVQAAELPAEGRATLALIRRGGPFPYRKDGSVFGNFERLLPDRPRGYYLEYTVASPGARGIVAGQGSTGNVQTSGEYYYTDDHYRSFRKIRE